MKTHILTAALVLLGCAGPKAAQTPAAQPVASVEAKSDAGTPAPKSLYERLGGQPAIEAVVAEFQANVAADPTINAPFGVADLKLLNKRLVEFVCMATGGPCAYTGRDMGAVHRGMKVTNAQFDSLVGALVKSLDKFHVPEREKSELLGALGPLRPVIVEID